MIDKWLGNSIHQIVVLMVVGALALGIASLPLLGAGLLDPLWWIPQEERDRYVERHVIHQIGWLQELAATGEHREAWEAALDLLRRHPNIPQVLALAGQLTQYRAQRMLEGPPARREQGYELLLQSAHWMRQAMAAMDPETRRQWEGLYAVALYNEACSLAWQGKRQQALRALKDAIQAGFQDLELLQQDEDLARLWNDDRFLNLVDMLREKLFQRQLEEHPHMDQEDTPRP